MQKNYAKTIIRTGLFTASFPDLLQPKEDMQGNMKYGICMLFDKNSKDGIDLKKQCDEEAIKAFGSIYPGLNLPYIDGDVPNRKGNLRPENKGKWVFKATSHYQPSVFNTDGSLIINPAEVYPGILATARVIMQSYNTPKASGTRFSLISVIKIKDGDKLAGGVEDSVENYGDISELIKQANKAVLNDI